jgi:hypothetical protein
VLLLEPMRAAKAKVRFWQRLMESSSRAEQLMRHLYTEAIVGNKLFDGAVTQAQRALAAARAKQQQQEHVCAATQAGMEEELRVVAIGTCRAAGGLRERGRLHLPAITRETGLNGRSGCRRARERERERCLITSRLIGAARLGRWWWWPQG